MSALEPTGNREWLSQLAHASARVTKEYVDDCLEEKLADAVGTGTREFVARELQPIREQLGSVGDASRVIDLQSRIVELEMRLAEFEKRFVALDTVVDAHRRHLSNLETKFGSLIHKKYTL